MIKAVAMAVDTATGRSRSRPVQLLYLEALNLVALHRRLLDVFKDG